MRSDLKKAEWYLTTGVDLGYTIPKDGAMNPDAVVEAWGVPEGLDDVVHQILNGDVRAAALTLQAYRVSKEPRPETAPMPFVKG